MAGVDPRSVDSCATRRGTAMLAWHDLHARGFLWRRTSDAWVMLVAEMLLRRTRASQAEPVVKAVLDAYPTPVELSSASRQDLEVLVRPAGLVSRADQLILAATVIVDRFDGVVPSLVADLEELPGVGPYVASAVAGAASGCQVMLIDTNTVRVGLRVAGEQVDAADVRRQRVVKESIHDLFCGPVSARLWWAVIDLAHAVCTPKAPRCEECPIVDLCVYGRRRLKCRTPRVRSTA